MQEYAVSQVLHWFRRFDDYQALKLASRWQPLPEVPRRRIHRRDYGCRRAGGEGCGKSATLGVPASRLEP
ncbi:hypothetical protein LN650_20615 [Klebsiella pneumoniae subsp. pneumoniae]|nr:hypothetical protein [Klebsiella pneumoniae subsp. pneumoniae]